MGPRAKQGLSAEGAPPSKRSGGVREGKVKPRMGVAVKEPGRCAPARAPPPPPPPPPPPLVFPNSFPQPIGSWGGSIGTHGIPPEEPGGGALQGGQGIDPAQCDKGHTCCR